MLALQVLTIIGALLSVSPPATAAEIYKCPGANGKTEFTDKPCATGAKVTVQPNSVEELDQSATKAKRVAVDKRIKEAQVADQADTDRRGRAQQAWADQCQGYLDEAKRQRAWLQSLSPAVRQSAASEITIQQRKYREADCGKTPP